MTRQERAAMMRADGAPLAQIGRALGVSESTISRWLNPERAEASRATSREWKRRQTGTCEKCGAQTRYGGRPERPRVGHLCAGCNTERFRESVEERHWDREMLILALHDRAEELGRTPPSTAFYGSSPSHSTFFRVFGSYQAALLAAGLEPNYRKSNFKVAA